MGETNLRKERPSCHTEDWRIDKVILGGGGRGVKVCEVPGTGIISFEKKGGGGRKRPAMKLFDL